MVEVYRPAHADPDSDFSMMVSHILGAHGIEWHSNIIVSTKVASVQACLEQFKALSRPHLLQMKDAIIKDFRSISNPDKELQDNPQRAEDLTNDCLCLAVASHVLDPERFPLIPYTSGFFQVQSPVKKPVDGPRVISPVP